MTSSQRTTAFSPSSGIGLSIVRVRVPNTSSEFAREKATIDACKSYGGSAIATAWSAPASMKTNNSVVGGKIKTSSYAAYASHLKAFNSAVMMLQEEMFRMTGWRSMTSTIVRY